MIKKIFYNSSLPRSLSTLLQNILGQNPDFYVTPTDGVLELIYGARQNFATSAEFKAQDDETMRKGWFGFCKGGIEGFYGSITDKPYVISKSRGWGLHYSLLKNIFNEPPKIICMVRDLKEIVASLENIHRKKESYSTDSMLNHSEMRNTTTEKRVDSFLNTQPLGLALERIREMIRFGTASNILFVRAESITSNPKEQLDRIYKYLGVDSYEHDFQNIEQITKEDDVIYGLTPDLHTIHREIKTFDNKAPDILGKDICKWFDETPQYEWYRRAFGYGNWKYKAELI